MTIDLQNWENATIQRLQGITEFPYIETQVLLSYTLNQPREWLIAHPDALINENELSLLDRYVQRLILGEPLPYITGTQAFYGLDFMVNADVLIPRPETELLVEEAVNWLQDHPDRRQVLDMGTGSGVIAVSLADQVPGVEVTAADVSPAALEVAKVNAGRMNVTDRLQIVQSDLFEHITLSFDLIAANLPYIPTKTLSGLPVSRFEPHLALDRGPDGLEVIRKFLNEAQEHLRPSGIILMEIESDQGDAVIELARSRWEKGNIRLLDDYAGLPRVVIIQS
jgi:release factor glutamine methyltransferase